MSMPPKAYYSDTNGVPKAAGRVTHLGLAVGELSQRVVSVGSLSRAKRLVASLDKPAEAFELTSDRGFTTYTGSFGGVRVSIVATGMGAPMMDFLVREARAVVDGPMLIVRYGSCGGIRADALPGTVVANTPGAVYVQRNYDAFNFEAGVPPGEPYHVSGIAPADPELASHVCDALKKALGPKAIEGLNASADSFYGSQGRNDPYFFDRNEDVVEKVMTKHPDAASMEMESFQLLHLANCSTELGDRRSSEYIQLDGKSIRAATAAIVCANRGTAEVITTEALHELEDVGGKAMLTAVTSCPLPLEEEAQAMAKRARR